VVVIRLLVCGSRTYSDYERLSTVLNSLPDRPAVVINGGMSGADALSSFWAYENLIDTECEGAKWGRHGKKAGPIRNQDMLERHEPNLVVAFYDKSPEQSRGTAHMVKLARQYGLEVIEDVLP
jgi:hypothetical protein